MADDRLWLPAGAALPKSKPTVRRLANPFELLSKQLRSQGFECKFRHDETERVIEVLFTPLTDKTRQAVKVASQSSQATGLKTMVHYGVLDDPAQAAVACLEKGLQELRQVL